MSEKDKTGLQTFAVINGERIETGDTAPIIMPHDHQHVLGHFHQATEAHVQQAIDAAEAARPVWAAMPIEERTAVFLRAGRLLEERYRYRMNAATMLNQSKTVHQAEIDSACEMIDFFRFNVHFMERLPMQMSATRNMRLWNICFLR